MAWNKFKSLGFMLDETVPKTRLNLRSCTFLVLFYGAQTWPLTEKKKKILQTCQRKMERRILRVVWSDRVTSAEVRQRTNVKDMVTVTHSLMWTWGGHAARTDQRGWAGAASMWDVRIVKRRTGRPKTRLGRDVQGGGRGTVVTNSKNRSEWIRNKNIRKAMSQTAQSQAESGYISVLVFSDASTNLPDRSEIVLHVPSVNSTSLGIAHLVIKHSSSP
jgi:hypothetical protein